MTKLCDDVSCMGAMNALLNYIYHSWLNICGLSISWIISYSQVGLNWNFAGM